jgi:hypothetical protein
MGIEWGLERLPVGKQAHIYARSAPGSYPEASIEECPETGSCSFFASRPALSVIIMISPLTATQSPHAGNGST